MQIHKSVKNGKKGVERKKSKEKKERRKKKRINETEPKREKNGGASELEKINRGSRSSNGTLFM
jgi:hypothetical protein